MNPESASPPVGVPSDRSASEQDVTPPSPRPVIAMPNRQPWVTRILLALTITVFAAQVLSENFLGYDLPQALGAKVNELILEGQLWRLFTPMLLHGGLLHIGFNMYALNILGSDLERSYGPWRFLALYILGGFAGNVASFMLTEAISVGASTAIFGLIGAQGILIYHNRAIFGSRARPALNRILYLAAINLVIGLSPGIDNWGHLGGLAGGSAFAWLAGPLWKLDGVFPVYRLGDRREPVIVGLAAVGVAALFSALVVGVIVFRSLS